LNWLERSRKLLQDASTEWGIKASLTDIDNYGSVFTRDAVMAGITGVLLDDSIIMEGLKKTIFHLKGLQGPQGQIPSNFKVKSGQIAEVSYGTLSPKIDSCCWYLIGVGILLKKGLVTKENYLDSVTSVVSLLNAWEYNGKHLMYVPKGGNWADEYVYEGYILYDQILRAWGLSLLAFAYDNKSWFDKSDSIVYCIKNQYKDGDSQHFHSSIYPGGAFRKFDLASHSLLGLILEKEDKPTSQSLDWIHNQFIKSDTLPPAFYPTIEQGDPDWETLRQFHLFGFKNKPNHYHNGGVWYIWLGWLAVTLSLHGKKNALDKLIQNSFEQLKNIGDFQFEEYLASDDLSPNGTKQLCYTASGIILLSLARDSFDFSVLKNSPKPLIKEPLIIKKEYFGTSRKIVEILSDTFSLKKKKIVIGICGESGSGKSVTAKCLQLELEKINIQSIILHQDSYYKLPPRENHKKRKSDLSWVGSTEVKMDLLQSHIQKFRSKEVKINVPILDYVQNRFLNQEVKIDDKSVLIVEGVYSFMLEQLDFKIFMARTYKDTIAKRKERSREIYDPFVEKVLQIEHSEISPMKDFADLIIRKDYSIAKNDHS